MAATCRSVSVVGAAALAPALVQSGSGSARRSSLPLALVGRSSTNKKRDGIIAAGSSAATADVSFSAPRATEPSPTMYATSAFWPSGRAIATTAARRIPGMRVSTPAISSGSMRTPPILTW